MSIVKTTKPLASVVHQPGEVTDEITWRFYPPEISVPKTEDVWFKPEEHRDSDPLVVPIRLGPGRGAVTPVRLAVWSLSLMLMLGTFWLLWYTEPPIDNPSTGGMTSAFAPHAEDSFEEFCEDTAFLESGMAPSGEEWIAEKVTPKTAPKRKPKTRVEEIAEKTQSRQDTSRPGNGMPMVEENPY